MFVDSNINTIPETPLSPLADADDEDLDILSMEDRLVIAIELVRAKKYSINKAAQVSNLSCKSGEFCN